MKGHFLNEDQKNVKQQIMEKLIDGMFDTLNDNKELFKNPQHILDIVLSCLVMFNRDTIYKLMNGMDVSKDILKVTDLLFSAVKKELKSKLSEGRH